MTISVIVPIYKVEAYLRQCVDSVLAQTYTDLDIVLVDDGSPDNSWEVMKKYQSEYPDLIKIASLSRNFGRAGAGGA